ncbi:hypothetical protein V2J09_002760 [Rumex salicifolius]
MGELQKLIGDVQIKESSTSVVIPDPGQWLKEARALSKDMTSLKERLNAKCVNGMLPNWCEQWASRSSLEEMLADLDGVIQRGTYIREKSTVRGIKQIQLPTVDVVGKNKKDIEDEIWDLISAPDEEGSIYIHGIAGVGKTEVAKAIHNKALEEVDSLFNYVIWVGMSYDTNLWRAQEDISNQLKIELPKAESTSDRATVLEKALEQKGKFLLVLDSVWQSFSIQDLGIPELVDGKKLIVTSRIRSVTVRSEKRKEIRDKKCKEIKPLSRAEAWELFNKEVAARFENLGLDLETQSRTEAAVEELDGLPLAIKHLARKLCEIRKVAPTRLNALWGEELDALGTTTSMPLSSCFVHSYDKLKVEAQHCLLYSALFPKAHLIKNKALIDYWMWEGLLGDIGTLEKCRKLGQVVLEQLKDAHLLLQGRDGNLDKVKMLNLVRRMAMVKAANPEDSLTLNDSPPEAQRAIKQLKALVKRNYEPNYSLLSTLLLQDNPLSSSIDDIFFSKMSGLRVLDLSRTMISMLPPSLSDLRRLRALLLRDCPNLTKLPDLSKLQDLIVLSLSGTPLDHCPRGLDNMLKLRSLDLTKTRLKTFPRNVVGKLIKLEELLFCTDHDKGGYLWRSKELHKHWNGACVEELVGLKYLAVLELNFLDTSVFNLYVDMAELSSKVPPKFRFYVGDLQNVGQVSKNSVTVSGSPTVTLPSGILELRLTAAKVNELQLGGYMRNLSVLDVSHLSRVSYLFTFEILGSLEMLKKLRVTSCKAMEGIVRPALLLADNSANVVRHRRLTTVVLFDLPSLQSVSCGQTLDCPSLVSLHVWRCDNLKMPKILGTKIVIRGDKSWLRNLTWDNPNNPNQMPTCTEFNFVPASVPLELEATTTR